MKKALIASVALVSALVLVPAAEPYLHFGGPDGVLAWKGFPIRYVITTREVPGVTLDQLRSALERSFDDWRGVPTASVSFEFHGFTVADAVEGDFLSTFGFEPLPGRVLGIARLLFDARLTQIVETDIAFTTLAPWSTAQAGEPGRHDLVDVATHEIGHMLGLAHSLIGETQVVPGGRRVLGTETVMFPIAFFRGSVADHVSADDEAGLSVLYPANGFRLRTGSIKGRVIAGGRGLFGAHVVTFDLETKKLVGGFSLSNSGDFAIAGLEPGPKIIRVEPLDDARVESFFDDADVDFRVTFLDRLVFVPAGGTVDGIVIEVAR